MSTSSSSSTTASRTSNYYNKDDRINHDIVIRSCHNNDNKTVKDPHHPCGAGGSPDSVMRLFSSSKRSKDKKNLITNGSNKQKDDDDVPHDVNNDNKKKKKKKKSFLKRIFKSNKKRKKEAKKNHQTEEKDEGNQRHQSPTLRSVTEQADQQQLIIENALFKDNASSDNNNNAGGAFGVQEVELSSLSSLHSRLSDFLLEEQQQQQQHSPGGGEVNVNINKQLENRSSPLPIYKDDDDDEDDYFNDYNLHQNPNDKKSSQVSRQQQHAESLDVTYELSFSSSLSLWTKNSEEQQVTIKKKTSDDSDDTLELVGLNISGDSSPESNIIYQNRDSSEYYEESEEEKTFNGLFEEEVHALEDTLSQIRSLSESDDNSSSCRTGSLSRHEEEPPLPVAPSPESPPHSSLILPNLSPIKPSKIASSSSPSSSNNRTTTDVPVMVSDHHHHHESNSHLPVAPRSPSPNNTTISQLDALASSATPTPVSPLQLKQRTKQDRFVMDNHGGSSSSGAAVNSITRNYHSSSHNNNNNDEEASVSTNNSVYLDCINQDDNNYAGEDAHSTATSNLTADGEICNNLLVQFDNYSNQYSLGLQIRNLVQERDELLAAQQKERELHQANYKAFCEKIQRLEQHCDKQRVQRQSLVEQLAHQSILHRESVLQLSMLRKQQQQLQQQQQQYQQQQQLRQQREQQQQKDNPWAQLTASTTTQTPTIPASSGNNDLLEKAQFTVQQEGAAILDRFLLDDHHREQLEQQLEDSLNERHQLIAKFGQELGIQLARYKQLDERFKLEQSKYNRQVNLNAQLEQQVFQLQQDYEVLEEKYTHLQDWQVAMIRKHERQQKRASPARRKNNHNQWTSQSRALSELDKENDNESDIQIMEA